MITVLHVLLDSYNKHWVFRFIINMFVHYRLGDNSISVRGIRALCTMITPDTWARLTEIE